MPGDKLIRLEDPGGPTVVSIEFSPLSTLELTTSWYQLHNGDYG